MSVTDASFPIINWSKAMPSLRQLMYFACVAEYGSIGQAAEVLHVSQPSLSRQIQALEVHIGEALLARLWRLPRWAREGSARCPRGAW